MYQSIRLVCFFLCTSLSIVLMIHWSVCLSVPCLLVYWCLLHFSHSSPLLLWTGKKSESETKKLVTAIHDLKERVKRETEMLKKIKEQLRDIQDRQQKERDVRTCFCVCVCFELMRAMEWSAMVQAVSPSNKASALHLLKLQSIKCI